MPVKRFELVNEIKATSPATDVQIVEDANGIRLTFSIYIKEKMFPVPIPTPPSDPEENTHRDIEMTASHNLYVSAQSVKLTASAGSRNPKLTLIAAIEGKIPGTGGFALDDEDATEPAEAEQEADVASQTK